jgi:UTP--glucose-1-phosphate uridylyltransferase
MPPSVMPIASSQVVVPIHAIRQPRTIAPAEVIAICLGVIVAELTRAGPAGSVLQVTADALDLSLRRLRDDAAGEAVQAAFARRFAQLQDPEAGLLAGDALEPVENVPELTELDGAGDRAILDRLAIIKLNGGLGTSMGLHGPKSLIEVKPGHTFLDVIARQVLALRARHGARLPLVLLDSFSTRARALEALPSALTVPGIPPDFLQSREPKLRADTLAPVDWPADPELEWCPPGHGDLYVSLHASGMLATLLDAGIDWAFVSNSDNLGAEADARIPAWADAHGVPFVMEVVRGTAADRKGGHIARRRDDGRLVLRETAQAPPGDGSFTDVDRWRFYNTNNLWVDLRALRRLLDEDPAGPTLPLIVNRKTVDPRDASSPPVLQLETAMGAAIGAVDGAQAVLVPRTRFAPVKTTDDLLLIRSDAYALDDAGHVSPTFDGPPPVVAPDPEYYKSLADLDRRFPRGAPSLRAARSLTVHGDVTFGANVQIVGDGSVTGPAILPDGSIIKP